MPGDEPLGRIVRFATFEVDLRSGELRKSGVRVALQDQPFKILARLLEHPGELVARDALRQELWANETYAIVPRCSTCGRTRILATGAHIRRCAGST